MGGILAPARRADRRAVVAGVNPARPAAPPAGRQPLGLGAGDAGPVAIEALIQPLAAATAHTAGRLNVHATQRLQFGDETVDHPGRRRAARQGVGIIEGVGQPPRLPGPDRRPLHGTEHVTGVQSRFDVENRPDRSGVQIGGACRRSLRGPTTLTPRRPILAARIDRREPAACRAAIDVAPQRARRTPAAAQPPPGSFPPAR
jgi:hypothetical protein